MSKYENFELLFFEGSDLSVEDITGEASDGWRFFSGISSVRSGPACAPGITDRHVVVDEA